MTISISRSSGAGGSAFEIAQAEGFSGTQQEWLSTLKGTDGSDGVDGIGGVAAPVFASRADAEAATVPPETMLISVIHDGELLTYIRDANGTALATDGGDQWRPAKEHTLLHWGAVRGGEIDCTAAAQAAFDYLSGGGSRAIHIHAGHYKISSTVTATFDQGSQGTVKTYGEPNLDWGPGLNGFEFTIDHDTRQNGGRIVFEPICLSTKSNPAIHDVTAVRLIGIRSPGNTSFGFSSTGLKLAGNTENAGWATGVHATDVHKVELHQPYFIGKAFNFDATAFLIDGTNSPTDHLLMQANAVWAAEAVRLEGNVEGVFVNDCNFVAVGVGVNDTRAGIEPLLHVNGGHISAYKACVISENGAQGHIKDGTHYIAFAPASYTEGVHAFVIIKGGDFMQVTGNYFGLVGSITGCKGVEVSGGFRHRIERNDFRGRNANNTLDVGVHVTAGASLCVEGGNRFLDVTTHKQIEAPSTLTKADPGMSVTVRRSTNVSVPANTDFAVPFSSVVKDAGGQWSSSQATRLTVPQGVREVDLKGSAWVGSILEGNVSLKIRRNGVDFIGQGYSELTAEALDNAVLQIDCISIAVQPGDYFELTVRHNQPTARNLVGSQLLYFTMRPVS